MRFPSLSSAEPHGIKHGAVAGMPGRGRPTCLQCVSKGDGVMLAVERIERKNTQKASSGHASLAHRWSILTASFT